MNPNENLFPGGHTPDHIAVAMSGGVDSTVAAALLKQSGVPVFGVYYRLRHAPDGGGSARQAEQDLSAAADMAAQLQIPFHVLDGADAFQHHVVETFIRSYAAGETPNPCIHCNLHIKWDFMLKKALALGATHLASGHYAQLQFQERFHLLRGIDRSKDQSYMLSFLSQEQFQHMLLPLGMHTKADVRNLAEDLRLASADRPDSQDLCFVGSNDYRAFLRRYAPYAFHEGPILNTAGEEIGRHTGLADYTIGQRKGIGIAQARPLYVLGKDIHRNALLVGEREELGQDELFAGPMHWIAGKAPALPLHAYVRVRYNAPDVPAVISSAKDRAVHATLAEPLPDITPGQAAVVYQGDECLGGGLIQAC